MKKLMVVILSLVMALTVFTPFSSASAKGNNGNIGNSGNNAKTVQVVLYSDEDQVITAEVPKSYEQVYLAKLVDPNFRNAEIQKSSGSGVNTLAATTESSSVYYMTKPDVIRMVASLDKSTNWSAYISNPLTDKLVTVAVAVITRSTVAGVVAGVMTWTTAWVWAKQEAWWKDSLIMILRKQITGVKLTVTPGPASGYPAAYITLTRY